MIRLRGLISKEFIQFFRDPLMIVLILWLFTIEIVVCSFALQFDVKRVPLAITDNDKSAASRALIAEFISGGAFVHAGEPRAMSEATRWLQAGRAQALLEVSAGFERDLQRASARVQLVLDGTNANTAIRARAYALEILTRFALTQAGGAHATRLEHAPSIRLIYNQRRNNMAFMALSMVALAALLVGILHPAASIVREKERGTAEQLHVTPISTAEIFFAKTLPTLLIALVATLPALLITRWFDIPLRGNLTTFFSLSTLFLLSATAIGVFISAITNTLQQALLLSFFSIVPMLALSGTMVPVESMPKWLQALSVISPLRHYTDVIVGIFLKGAGLSELWQQSIALAAIGLAMYGAAFVNFQRRWSQ